MKIMKGDYLTIRSRSVNLNHNYMEYARNKEERFTSFTAKVLEVYPRFCLVEYQRGFAKVRECFFNDDLEKWNTIEI